MSISIRPLTAKDAAPIGAAFEAIGWDKPASKYERYFAEQTAGERTVLVAEKAGRFAGYVTIVWQPAYPYFRERGVPEINDLNVLPDQRRQGTATALLDEAERLCAERGDSAGIGFGLDAGYGVAQALYIRRGYVPDGQGAAYDGRTLIWGETVPVNDSLVLYLMKELRSGRCAQCRARSRHSHMRRRQKTADEDAEV